MSRLLIALALIASCKKSDPSTGATVDLSGSTTQDAGIVSAEDTPTPGCLLGVTDAGTCAAAPLCTTCSVDADCGGGRCLLDARGQGFCTRRCDYLGDTVCPTSYYCKQFGTGTKDFHCAPVTGVCKSDGLECAPCTTATDCQSGMSCIEPLGDVKFCAKSCTVNADCGTKVLGCGHVAGAEVCLPMIDGTPTAKCGARPIGFCEPCETGGDCATGTCADSPNVGKVCSKACQSVSDCPEGTFCVQSACLPPLATGCQGWLSCLSVFCADGLTCYHGLCIPPP